MNKATIIIFFAIFSIMIPSFGNGENSASGTGCPPIGIEKRLQQVPLIFSGTVISKEHMESGFEITFQINEIVKGPPITKITLHTFELAEFGIKFNEKDDYLVFAEYFDGILSIDPICSGSVSGSIGPEFINEVKMRIQNLGYESWTPIDKVTEIQKRTLQDFFEKLDVPPLKQISKFGIESKEVTCTEDLQLIFKSTDGSPACVKPKTAEKLIERGWASN